MTAVALIVLGYLGVIAAFGWWGVAGVALHVGVVLAGLPRR